MIKPGCVKKNGSRTPQKYYFDMFPYHHQLNMRKLFWFFKFELITCSVERAMNLTDNHVVFVSPLYKQSIIQAVSDASNLTIVTMEHPKSELKMCPRTCWNLHAISRASSLCFSTLAIWVRLSTCSGTTYFRSLVSRWTWPVFWFRVARGHR